MDAKTPLGKLTELIMHCQEKKVTGTLKQLEKLPTTPELEAFKKRMLQEHEYLMIDCKAILKAEKAYLQTLLN